MGMGSFLDWGDPNMIQVNVHYGETNQVSTTSKSSRSSACSDDLGSEKKGTVPAIPMDYHLGHFSTAILEVYQIIIQIFSDTSYLLFDLFGGYCVTVPRKNTWPSTLNSCMLEPSNSFASVENTFIIFHPISANPGCFIAIPMPILAHN